MENWPIVGKNHRIFSHLNLNYLLERKNRVLVGKMRQYHMKSNGGLPTWKEKMNFSR